MSTLNKETYLSLFGQNICVEFHMYSLKFQAKYLIPTLDDVYFIKGLIIYI